MPTSTANHGPDSEGSAPPALRPRTHDRYTPTLASLSDPARHLFESYSHIPPEQVVAHILEQRDRAFEIYPYPCIGHFRFLDLAITRHPAYAEVLARLRGGGHTLLDIGCCVGQDVRAFVADGAPSERIIASDLRAEFWEIGYQLFRDRETLRTRFVAGDVFNDADERLKELESNSGVDAVLASSFFHLWEWEQQVKAAGRVLRLLKRKKGSLVFGRQTGHVEPGRYERSSGRGGRWRHDPASLRRLWTDVGKGMKMELELQCEWDKLAEVDMTVEIRRRFEEGARWLWYTVRLM